METNLCLKDKLDVMIGFGWWKRYIAAAFWSNITTPLNLSITLLTALTTMQISSSDVFSKDVITAINVTALSLSTLNTFFRPHHQMTELTKSLAQWTAFGNAFEDILVGTMDTQERQSQFEKLHREINAYRITQTDNFDQQNFLTDLLHTIARVTVLRKRERWLQGGGSGHSLA